MDVIGIAPWLLATVPTLDTGAGHCQGGGPGAEGRQLWVRACGHGSASGCGFGGDPQLRGAAPSPCDCWWRFETSSNVGSFLERSPAATDTQRGPRGRKKAFPELFQAETSSSVQKMTHFRSEKQNKPCCSKRPQFLQPGSLPAASPCPTAPSQPWAITLPRDLCSALPDGARSCSPGWDLA